MIHPEADPENEVDPYFGKRLLGGGHQSIEGPYIQYDADTGYYYLYLSFGSLERTGVTRSGYCAATGRTGNMWIWEDSVP